MIRRMYFVLNDMAAAKAIANELLLARIDNHQMRFIAREGTDLGDLPEASFAQKTDFVHSAQVGLVGGAAIGMVLGWFVYARVLAVPGVVLDMAIVLAGGLAGGFIGAWASSMIGAGRPNSRHRKFEKEIAGGKYLLMVDVPVAQVTELAARVQRRVPEALNRGVEAAIPAFP